MKKEEADQSGYRPNETYQDLEPGYNPGETYKFGGYDDEMSRDTPVDGDDVSHLIRELHSEVMKFSQEINEQTTDSKEEYNRTMAVRLAVEYLQSQDQRVKPEDLEQYMNTIFNFLNK